MISRNPRRPEGVAPILPAYPNDTAALAQPPSWIRRHWAVLVQWYLLLASLSFVALSGYVHTVPRPLADVAFSQWLQAFDAPWFDALMRLVDLIGFDWKALVIIGLILSLIFLTGLRREAILGLIASTSIW